MLLLMVTAIMMLEIFVAFLQAFIFTILTGVHQETRIGSTAVRTGRFPANCSCVGSAT